MSTFPDSTADSKPHGSSKFLTLQVQRSSPIARPYFRTQRTFYMTRISLYLLTLLAVSGVGCEKETFSVDADRIPGVYQLTAVRFESDGQPISQTNESHALGAWLSIGWNGGTEFAYAYTHGTFSVTSDRLVLAEVEWLQDDDPTGLWREYRVLEQTTESLVLRLERSEVEYPWLPEDYDGTGALTITETWERRE